MNSREEKIAIKFNILEKIQKLESELLDIEGVTEVDFSLSGFYDNMNEVIFLTKYRISGEEYYNKRTKLKNKVINVSINNGLVRTGDRIEDYGEHLYFVMKHDENWLKHPS